MTELQQQPQVQTSNIRMMTIDSEIIQNTNHRTLQIGEDKLRVCLMNHSRNLESRDAWIAPASLLVSLGTTLISSTFQNVIFAAATWTALYVFFLLLALLWLIRSLLNRIGGVTVDSLMAALRSDDLCPPPTQTHNPFVAGYTAFMSKLKER